MKSRSVTVVAVLAVSLLVGSPATAQQAEAPAAGEGTFTEDREPAVVELEDAERVYTLDELIERVRDQEDLSAELGAARRKASWQQYRADYGWGPKLKATTLAAPVPDNAEPDRFEDNLDELTDLNIGPYIRLDVEVVQPLYTFGRISTAQQLAELGMENADEEANKTRLELFFELKRAYYSLQLSRAFAELLQEGEELVSEKLAEMEEARDFGEADFDIADLRKLQIFSAELDTRILDNQKLSALATAGIHYLADIDPEVTIAVPPLETDDEPPALRPLDYYVDQAMRTRPEIRQLQKAVQARGLEVELAEAEFYPNIFAAANFGFGWSTEETALQKVCVMTDDGCDYDATDLRAEPYSDPLDRLSFGVALGARWEFDFFQLRGKLGEKRAQLDQVVAQRERARGAIRLEIAKLWQDAHDALEKIEINARRLKAAERWRDQFGLSLQTGGGDMSQALDPLKAFYEARALYLQALYDYLVARAQLAKAVGEVVLEQAPNGE